MSFRFIDLFAGIGGTRIPFDEWGGQCVFSSDIDKFAKQTYVANFNEYPHDDITKIPNWAVPDHELLIAGFPCQPFSIAGVSKNNSLGRGTGFEDQTRGTLFFDIARILKAKRPKAFLLENVKNLQAHDKGRTFEVIKDTLTKELGYSLKTRVYDAKAVVPQHRERIFMVGFTDPAVEFEFPELPQIFPKLGSILEPGPIDGKYTLTDGTWEFLQRYAEKHQARGNGFGFGLVGPEDTTRTISARYYKDGSEILIKQARKNPRKLTPREAARLMGFPETFKLVVSDTQAYKQFGNAVVVPVVRPIAQQIVAALQQSSMQRAA
jgi:DNA (cytosine-5)-methyltransferase 1